MQGSNSIWRQQAYISIQGMTINFYQEQKVSQKNNCCKSSFQSSCHIMITHSSLGTGLKIHAFSICTFSPWLIFNGWTVGSTQYLYLYSKVLKPVFYFADLVQTSLWVFREEQHAQYIWFLPQTSQEGNECTTTK